MIVKPLERALITFTAFAAVVGSSPKKMMKTLPNITKRGAPGGWGICSLKQELTNSPQSHKLPPASAVMMYTEQAIKVTIQPTILLILLKDIFILV